MKGDPREAAVMRSRVWSRRETYRTWKVPSRSLYAPYVKRGCVLGPPRSGIASIAVGRESRRRTADSKGPNRWAMLFA
jgi:hypothetical protein